MKQSSLIVLSILITLSMLYYSCNPKCPCVVIEIKHVNSDNFGNMEGYKYIISVNGKEETVSNYFYTNKLFQIGDTLIY